MQKLEKLLVLLRKPSSFDCSQGYKAEVIFIMTEEQKSRIHLLRERGLGYIRVAQALGISENTVKSYCRRNKLTGKLEHTLPEHMNGKNKIVTKIIEPGSFHALMKLRITEEQLCDDYKYCMAQKIIKKMLNEGLISVDKFNKISERNRQTFSPYFSEIMP
jgi:predicted transcriptional regulator